MNKTNSQGFTLIELMIVVVIIGVLSSFAYSSYQDHVRKARRTDAKGPLTQLANIQEKFFTECNRYAAQSSSTAADKACSTAADPGSATLIYSALSPENHYRISILAPVTAGCTTANCYLLEADPNGAGTTGLQSNDGRFRIDQAGRKSWDKNDTGTVDANGMFNGKWSDKK
ncbi:MAG: type IV pilin protein [Gammaproteobacteria bacterium]|nr:type IV pilin protein [Gammaproteobacteria bacterium]